MSDKLIRYEALSALISALNSGIALAQQQSGLATAATTASSSATSAALAQTTATQARTAETIQARDGANQAAINANAQTALAAAAVALSQTQTGLAQTATGYASAQGDYAKQWGDYARTQAQAVGNMSKAMYDVNLNGVVDDSERLAGLLPSAYVRSAGGDQTRHASVDQRTSYPSTISSTQGYARFRFGSIGENNAAPFADIIDLSTYGDATGGGVNALYFRKDTGRITHKYGLWAGSTWASVRDLAYVDETSPRSESVVRDGSVPMTGPLQIATSGLRFPLNAFGGSGDTASIYLGRVGDAITGDNQELRIEVGNDAPLDRISLRALRADGTIDPNGAYVGAGVIWNAGNFDPSTKANAVSPVFTGDLITTGNLIFSGQASLNPSASALTVNTGTGRDLLLNPQTGRVGVNTPSAAYTLDVNGTARIAGALLVGSIRTDAPLGIVTLGFAAQRLYAGGLQVGSNYNALLDAGVSGVSMQGDLLIGGAARLTTAPVFEGTGTRTAVGSPYLGLGTTGFPLNPDSGFRSGMNGVLPYNNSGTLAITVTRAIGTAASGNRSTQVLTVRYDSTKGAVSPGMGGFAQNANARSNATFVHRFRARLQAGASFVIGTNNIGTGGFTKWLTPLLGTGKWEDYAYLVSCGDGSGLQDFGYVYVTGPTATFEWYLEDACVYDVTTSGLNELLSSGGSFQGPVTALSLLSPYVTASTGLALPSAAGNNNFLLGTGDGGSYATHNARLHLHYGLGIEDYSGTVNGVYDARLGRWTVKGGLSIDNGAGTLTALAQHPSGALNLTTAFGTTAFGAQSAAASGFNTTLPSYLFDKKIVVSDAGGFTVQASYLSATAGAIAGQSIVTTNDTRLKDWGLYSTNGGQDFLGRGGRVIVASADAAQARTSMYLNYAGDFPGGVTVQGAGMTLDGTIFTGGLLTASGVNVRSGNNLVMQASAAIPNDSGDLIFSRFDGTELGRVFIDVGTSNLKLTAQGDYSSGLEVGTALNIFRKPVQSIVDSGAIDANLYNRAALQIVTPNAPGAVASLAFTHIGSYGAAMYLHPTSNRMRMRGSDNNDSLLLTTQDVDEAQVTGIRSTPLSTPQQDGNTIRPAGNYHGYDMLNMPIAGTWFYLQQNAHDDSNYASQSAQHYFSENLYLRRKDAGVWQPWRSVYHTGNFDPGSKFDKAGGSLSGALSGTTAQFSADSGAQDSGLYSRSQLKVVGVGAGGGGSASVGFAVPGVDAIALKYKGGNELYLQYTGESRLWHSNNFDPGSKANLSGASFSGVLAAQAGAQALQIQAGTADHAYIGFFPRTAIPGLRRGYLGFAGAASNDIVWVNEYGGANIALYGNSTIGVGGALTSNSTITATDFLKSSVRALKQDIAPYQEDALAAVAALDIVTFTYRADVEGRPNVGIIADDTANELVSGPQHDAFNTANALAIALKAIQQLSVMVAELQRKVGNIHDNR